MGRRQAVRHGILIPAYPGSNPGAPAKGKWTALCTTVYSKCTARRQDENREVRRKREARSERRSRPRRGERPPAVSHPGAPAKGKWTALCATVYSKCTARRQDENRKVRRKREARSERRSRPRRGERPPAVSHPGAPAKGKWTALCATVYSKCTARRQDENREVRRKRVARSERRSRPRRGERPPAVSHPGAPAIHSHTYRRTISEGLPWTRLKAG